jgi:hypothetical protein
MHDSSPAGHTPSVLAVITRRRSSGGGAAVLTAGLALACVAPVAADAGGGAGAILKDCEADGQIDGTYPPAAYAKALSALPTDLDEYSDCRSVIRSAQLRAAGAAKPRSGPSAAGPGAAGVGAGGSGDGGSSNGAGGGAPSGKGGRDGGTATARSASASPPAQGAPAPVSSPVPAGAAPVGATAHEAAVSPAQVAGGLALLALAVALAGALGPRYLPRVLRRMR